MSATTPYPSINHVLAVCNSSGKYRDTLLCRLASSLAEGDARAAREHAHRLLELTFDESREAESDKARPGIYVSAGPGGHWRDSFMYASRSGLVPWACGFSLEESIYRRPEDRGPRYLNLIRAIGKGFTESNESFEVTPPIVVFYATGNIGAIGFGLALWADASPLRGKLWSGESCPPGEKEKCFTVRWYVLPIALGCRVIDDNGIGAVTSECSLKSVNVGRAAFNCAQSVSKDYDKVAGELLATIEGGEGLELVRYASELVSAAAKRPVGRRDPVAVPATIGVAGSPPTSFDEPWSVVLAKPETFSSITGRLSEMGVNLPEALVRMVALLLARGNVLLAGPPGCGKTLLGRVIAEATGSELIAATCHAGWTRSDFIGGPSLLRGGLVWRSGYLVRAIARALEGRRVLLLVDEVNRAEVDKVFGEFFTAFSSPAADEWNIDVICGAVCGEAAGDRDEPANRLCEACARNTPLLSVVRRNLRILATMNTVDYSTVFSVGEAFGRRFYKVEFLLSSNPSRILEREVKPAYSYVLSRINGDTGRLAGLEELLENLAAFVAGLREARGESSLAGVLVTQLPLGPAFIREVLVTAAHMLLGDAVSDAACAVIKAILVNIPVTVLVDEDSRRRLRSALNKAFGEDTVKRCSEEDN